MDLSEIADSAVADTNERELPPIVPNSELQLDADISCYLHSWPEQPLSTDIQNLKLHIETMRLLSGSEYVNVYTTHGDKAGRDEIAQVQQYQKGRSVSDPEKKKRVEELRHFLTTFETDHIIPRPQWTIEADDAISIRQRECLDLGLVSKIMTVDKDLDMVPGIHIDMNTFVEKYHPDSFGSFEIKESGTLKSKGGDGIKRKVKGYGTCFFWLQLLMGDKADDIPGLPQLTTALLNKYKPTKAVEKATKTLANPRATQRAKTAAQNELTKRKPANIGQMLAYTILKDCKTDFEAFKRVREAYKAYYGEGEFPFTTWRGETITTTANAMLVEQARLLWMMRHLDDDAVDFITDVVRNQT